MVVVRLPGHDGDHRDERQADQAGQRLKPQGDATLPAAEPQEGGLQLPLLVQVLGLQIDQSGLLAQERGRISVEHLAAL